jgi:hypothetical protein
VGGVLARAVQQSAGNVRLHAFQRSRCWTQFGPIPDLPEAPSRKSAGHFSRSEADFLGERAPLMAQ